MPKLSHRLQTIISLVPSTTCVADIGSDHAFVPITLVQEHQTQRAIASEIAPGPLAISQQNIADANLGKVIQTRQADGLQGLTEADQVEVVIIAGMGGQLITRILTQGIAALASISCLILEANNDEPQVRLWLSQHHWQITAECLVQEDGHIYEIIRAEKVEQAVFLTSQELLFGPKLLAERSSVFLNKWRDKLQRTKFMYQNLQHAQKQEPAKIAWAQQRIQEIEEVLK
ncbi:tRNA (adenine(22)-N(1))-methyltransferase TrmK [Lactobacillus sp. DCY120]|uniref:tRNA (Adenine(22)-N(1))-methyltransferase TrmK n=1 Tax=Bombilactobacillus apium TaxID=2675299 RepID=A0A850QVL6_9LACO|nr:tRNA (adenine(22)-N(1))-methyltransferase TrmK [Bombilactobacillus apium]NVY95834.1 tRNA (adenine(22)-N(1))-methyltransferase TrmK [Bombilactobacillus apium]